MFTRSIRPFTTSLRNWHSYNTVIQPSKLQSSAAVVQRNSNIIFNHIRMRSSSNTATSTVPAHPLLISEPEFETSYNNMDNIDKPSTSTAAEACDPAGDSTSTPNIEISTGPGDAAGSCTTPNAAAGGAQQEPKLPKLTASEFREYNRLSEHMNSFHNHFRLTWNDLYATVSGTAKKDSRLSPSQFLRTASRFLDTLTMHHDIEETYVFPKLATRMPAFQQNLVLINQHKQIHAGMDKLGAYLAECKKGVRDMRMDEIKEIMDTWKDVLWAHLDKEVEELGAENMRKYWSLREMRTLGF